MNIVIINQHAGNHGDEAAGKGLLRNIVKINNIKYENIQVLYNSPSINKYEILDDRVNNIASRLQMTILEKILLILTFILPFSIIKFLILSFTNGILKKEINILKSADKVINAPGGVNIGPYKDWRYIWRLYVSLKLKKDVAIYSISFGPIPEEYIFNKVSLYILKNVNFLSLRDNKSQEYADKLGIKYIKAIDTAFLSSEDIKELPSDISNLVKKEYVIIVPNQLYKWHPNFKNYSKKEIDNIYINIIKYFTNKKISVYLLPQLVGSQNDINYFEELANKFETNVEIIDEKYSSDIQQIIIKNANFLIGARYHSIIFSINNNTPFLSLAYEHKMTNTLSILGLLDNNLDLHDILNENVDLFNKLDLLYNNKSIINNEKSKDIAIETFYKLKKDFLHAK